MTLKKSLTTHPRLGKIIVTHNPRARKIIMRAQPDAIYVTAPQCATATDIERALNHCCDELLHKQQESKQSPISKGYTIDTPNFRLNVQESNTTKIKLTGKEGNYTLHCPQGTDYTRQSTQQTLRQGIKAAMKHCATTFLPHRLEALAHKHNFKYSKCTVRDTRTRWGSCTSRSSISLNIHLIMLPDRLIDYVLLHELCHTVEMNHSDKFWALLDCHTAPASAKALRAELRKVKTIF